MLVVVLLLLRLLLLLLLLGSMNDNYDDDGDPEHQSGGLFGASVAATTQFIWAEGDFTEQGPSWDSKDHDFVPEDYVRAKTVSLWHTHGATRPPSATWRGLGFVLTWRCDD